MIPNYGEPKKHPAEDLELLLAQTHPAQNAAHMVE
jgi:hypothetical protein